MDNSQVCTFYIVRHGQTDWNIQKKMQGHVDNPLNEIGKSQAEIASNNLKAIHFDAIYSSDLLRAKQTADIINLRRNLAIQTTKILREKNFGEFQGMERSEFTERTKYLLEDYQKLSDDDKWKYTYGKDYESDESVVSRVMTFLREVAISNAGKTILVVTHHGVIGLFLTKIGYIEFTVPPPISITNAGFIKVLSDGIDFEVVEAQGVIHEANKSE